MSRFSGLPHPSGPWIFCSFNQKRSTCRYTEKQKFKVDEVMSSPCQPSDHSSPAEQQLEREQQQQQQHRLPSTNNKNSYRESDANIRNFAPVARIMKSALPENAKIAKEAKECMQECVSEFISFITSEGEFAYDSSHTNIDSHLTCFQHRRSASRRSERQSMARIFCSP